MNFFARILKTIDRSQQLKADRQIRRYAYLVEQVHEYDKKQNISAVGKKADLKSKNMDADVGGITVRRHALARGDGEYTGAVVVATIWLLFFAAAFANGALKQGSEMLAFLH